MVEQKLYQNRGKNIITVEKYKKMSVFWGNSPSYKNDIIDFIINYK